MLNKITARQVVFLIILISVALPLIFNLSLKHEVTPEVLQVYTNIDTLAEGDAMIISFDFEASALPEVRPLAVALIRHAFSRNIRIFGMSLFAEGTALGEQTLRQIAKEYGKVYGVDWVYLGFRPQREAAILSLGVSISAEFPTDYFGTPSDTMTIFREIDSYEDVASVVSISDGDMPSYWIEYAVSRHGVNLQAVITATMATSFYPYLRSGQLKGLLAGLKGAAEYEKLIERKGGGARGLFALSVSQFVVVLVIIAGNVAERLRRRKS
jgi:hypothetical protein